MSLSSKKKTLPREDSSFLTSVKNKSLWLYLLRHSLWLHLCLWDFKNLEEKWKLQPVLHVHYIFKFSFPKVRWMESWVQRDWGGAGDDHNGHYNRCHLQSTDCMPSSDKYNIYTLLRCMNPVQAPPPTATALPRPMGCRLGIPSTQVG